MESPWIDLTVRLKEDVEVGVHPDNTIELSCPMGGTSRATILLTADAAKALNQRLGELLMLIPGDGPTAVDPS